MAVLDTSFLIDLLRGHAPAVAVLDRLEEQEVLQVVPAPVVFELAVELGKERTPRRRARKLLSALEGLKVQSLDKETALDAGRILGRLEDQGTPIDDLDCMIAAVALRMDEPLVTANRKHFAQVDGLRLVDY